MAYLYIILIVLLFIWMLWWCMYKKRVKTVTHSFTYQDPLNGPSTYRIYLFDNFLTAKECEVIQRCATPRLKPSATLAGIHPDRTSDTCFIKMTDLAPQHKGILQKIKNFTAEITKTSIDQQEVLQVCRYEKDQFYKAHFDACDPYEGSDALSCQKDNAIHGIRYATLLIYLNDVVSGGETHFPKIDYTCKPKRGRAVLFYNLTQSNRPQQHPLSIHAALPVIDGEKWVCNQWVRLPIIEHQQTDL